MKKRVLVLGVLLAFLFTQTVWAEGQFNGYDIVGGIIMDEYAQEKISSEQAELQEISPSELPQEMTQEMFVQSVNSEVSDEMAEVDEYMRAMEEERNYSDRFIVKYKNSNKAKASDKVKKATKNAFDKTKKAKENKKAKWNNTDNHRIKEMIKHEDSMKLAKQKKGDYPKHRMI